MHVAKAISSIFYTTYKKAEIMCEANPMSRADPKGDPKVDRNPELVPKGQAPENPKPALDMTGKLGKNGKLQERQCRMDNSLCLFYGKTGHIAKECPKSSAIAAQAHAAIAKLQELFMEEVKKGTNHPCTTTTHESI